MTDSLVALEKHRRELLGCRRCSEMIPPVVAGPAVDSRVLLLGQAPGRHEGDIGRPFAWTAGRTLFTWFEGLGVNEEQFRRRVFMAAVCRCFPGKAGSGDRVPNRVEIDRCSVWLAREVELLEPELVIAVGKLAISRLLEFKKLVDVVGEQHRARFHGRDVDVVPLPHPSGASTWFRTEPGSSLLSRALERLSMHPAFAAIRDETLP